MNKQHLIIKELANVFSHISTYDGNSATAIAVLDNQSLLSTENRANISLESGTAVLTTEHDSVEGGSVIAVDVLSGGSYGSTPNVTIQSPGYVSANAIPQISPQGQITGGIIDRHGGIYASAFELLTEFGDVIRTEQTDKNLIGEITNTERPQENIGGLITDQLYDITTEKKLDILTDMGFKIATELPLMTESPLIEIPITVHGDGSGASVVGLADLEGRVIIIQTLRAGANYTHASFEFPKPALEIPPATARAIIMNGRVSSIEVTYGSYDYLFIPKVTITGGEISLRKPFQKVYTREKLFKDIPSYPQLCVYPHNVGYTNDGLRRFIVNAKFFCAPSYQIMDEILEDIFVVSRRYPTLSSLDIATCGVVRVDPLEDLYFSAGFGVGRSMIEVIYEDV